MVVTVGGWRSSYFICGRKHIIAMWENGESKKLSANKKCLRDLSAGSLLLCSGLFETNVYICVWWNFTWTQKLMDFYDYGL